MKYILTTIVTTCCMAAMAQNNQVIKNISDDGKTLQVLLKVKNDSTSLHFERSYDVTGMNKSQKNELVYRVIDSLGLSKYYKTSVAPSPKPPLNHRPDEKRLVVSAVMDYVDAFYSGDTSKISSSFAPAIAKYGYYRKKDETTYAGEPMSRQQMIDYALKVKGRNNAAAAEKLFRKVEILDYQDQTASAKLYAWWGTDYILLAKQDGKWMITHVLWQSSPPNKQ